MCHKQRYLLPYRPLFEDLDVEDTSRIPSCRERSATFVRDFVCVSDKALEFNSVVVGIVSVSNTAFCDSRQVGVLEVETEDCTFLDAYDYLDTVASVWDASLWDNPEVVIVLLVAGVWKG